MERRQAVALGQLLWISLFLVNLNCFGESRVLADGTQIEVPTDVITVPGEPVVLMESDATRIRSMYEQVQQQGYADVQDSVPEVDIVFNKIRASIADGRSQGLVRFEEAKLQQLPFPIGKFPREFVNEESDNYLYFIGDSVGVRVFERTSIGSIYIREFQGGEIRVGGEPDYEIAGFSGYLSKVRYADGQWVTAVLISNGVRTILMQASSDLSQRATRETFDKILASLLTTVE